jgi:glycosyltransferase involved in cell wall biosynthesis
MGNRILILSSSDYNGGASEYAYRIACFLNEAGYEIALAVRERGKLDTFIYHLSVSPAKRSLSKRLYNKLRIILRMPRLEMQTDSKYVFFDEDETKENISANEILRIIPFSPDLILAGTTDRFVNTKILSDLERMTGARIFLIMVDMSVLTGGCHIVWNCKGFERHCNNCPAILDKHHKSYPSENLRIKLFNIRKSGIQIITGSAWTKEQAEKSTLFRGQKEILNINSCIDTRIFNARQRAIAKRIFNIDDNAKLIFIGTNNLKNEHKGLEYFVEALKLLWDISDNNLKGKIYIMILGNRNTENELTIQIPFKKRLVDFIKDYRLLSLAYQASDVFVCPSLEDGGPMMVSEALACGTPVVGFKTGVLYNLVKTDYNGYVAEMRNSKDLAFGMKKIVSLSDEEFNVYSKNAVEMIERYSSKETVVSAIHKILQDSLI